ncbi:hypothetical protein [Bacteroides sp.]|uniref:hypothetical protein n=1 Tax=Bacteroides sp. TaxID=29523 RepID=UPI002628FFD4|nr:hypothetical protein [Bacteroides sp.]
MKTVLIGIALSFISILSFSQERINTETYLQFDKTTKALKKVMGYRGTTGEWKSEKNQITHALFDETQKFDKLTVKTTTLNDTLYYVLVRNFLGSGPSDFIVKSGDVYKYQGGGSSSKTDILYFFIASEFEQIFHLDKNSKTINSFRHFNNHLFNYKSDFSKITTDIIENANKNNKKDFMQIRIADDGKMVRFLLPYQKDERWGKDYDLFSECYFEMPLRDFYKWLEPVAPIKK